jgi:hypothetical protein
MRNKLIRSVCAALVALTLGLGAAGVVHASLGNSDEPVTGPEHHGKPVGQHGTGGLSGVKYIKNGSKAGRNCDSVEVSIKANKQGKNTEGNDVAYDYEVVVEDIKNPTTGASIKQQISPADGKASTDGGATAVTVKLNPPLPPGASARADIKVRRKKKNPKDSPWEDAFTDKVLLNFKLLGADGQAIVQAGTGDSPFGDGTLASISEVFPGANLAASACLAGSATTVAAPDLVFAECNNWRMSPGILRFVATGGAGFEVLDGAALAVTARDEQGVDAVTSGGIELGEPTIVNGEIQVSVTGRDPALADHVALRITGAAVVVPALAGGTDIGYSVGGTSAGSMEVRVAPLVRVGGAPLAGSVTWSRCAVTTVTESEGEAETSIEHVGGLPLVVWKNSGGSEGYLDAFVIEESDAGFIREGSFEITPTDGLTFMESEHTKLCVLDMQNEAIPGAFATATIGVTPKGAIRVTLGQRSAQAGKLRLVILNPKVSAKASIFANRRSGRVAIGGSALRGGFPKTVILLEPMPDSAYERPLPTEPLNCPGLAALATME